MPSTRAGRPCHDPAFRSRAACILRSMSIASPAEPVAAGVQSISTRWRWALLVGSFVVTLMFLGNPAVTRSQEARVLETAREMMHSGWRGWLIPRLNDTLRLEKPPLAYWLSAVAFYIGGV